MQRAIYSVLSLLLSCVALRAAEPNHGPWDLAALKQAPEATWGEAKDGVREVYYSGEPLGGKATRVFAYYAQPEGAGPFPAMVLVHGGGGKAFREWAVHWQKRGYAALAMDLAGNGPNGRLADGGPNQDDGTKFKAFDGIEAKEMWTYHAVAAVIRGHSLLAARKEVDPARIGITGISWGGYLTCIVAGLDDRLKVAVPVYGCGFLAENSVWKNTLAKMPAEQRERWVNQFDPSQYLPRVRCPILFLNGTNDFAYPLDSYQKSYSLVPEKRWVSVVPRLAHGHIWTFKVVDLFVDWVLREEKSLPKVSALQIEGDTASATATSETKLTAAELHYAVLDKSKEWHTLDWKSLPAKLENDRATAALPAERPLACYLSITDERGLFVTTPHVLVK